MTSLILENADLNRLFPKCRPRGGPPPGASTQSSQQPHDSPCQTEAAAIITATAATTATAAAAAVVTIASTSTSISAISDDMIDLERDISDRQVKPTYWTKRRIGLIQDVPEELRGERCPFLLSMIQIRYIRTIPRYAERVWICLSMYFKDIFLTEVERV